MVTIDKNQIPNFANVAEFARWYANAGMPTLFPEKHEVFVSDDATASCMFRYGRFQFEMYFIHPNPVIPLHEHPGVENIEIPSNHLDFFSKKNIHEAVQKIGESHGVGFKERASHNGFVLMSAQMWDEELAVSTIGARWKGNTAGPKHEALIRRFNPDCLIYPGYADVTVKMQTSQVL